MDEVKDPVEAAKGSAGEGQPGGGTAVADSEPPQAETTDSAALTEPTDQLAALAMERDQLVTDKADLQDRLLRRQAEFDNFRKRAERERLEWAEFSGMEVVKAVLPIADDFERALKVECADKEYVRGMELIYQRLTEVLKKQGLEPIEAQGQKFDPNLHHAVNKGQSDEHEEDTVLEEYQKGYNFKGRLLRPAMVKVSVK
ncbi:MAG: nucleotide exchange factor GrpE [Acidobacteria bacterium]|nr:nucleotide exchange factor GrpE [Acidobacteriota bacterium]